MIYDYIIVGLGPTGITLGLNLLKTRKTVLFIESESEIGGCWKTLYTHDGFFSEHSPKVLSEKGSKTFNKLINHLKVDPKYRNIYETSTLLNVTGTVLKEFLVMDIIKLLLYGFLYIIGLNNKQSSVEHWCKSNHISKRAQKFMNIIAIAISNTYDKLTMHTFIQFNFKKFQYLLGVQQLYEPKEWLSACIDKFKKNNNFYFLMNTTVDSFMFSNDSVSYITTNYADILKAKEYICCIPVRSLYKIMYKSFEPNWFTSLDHFKRFVDKSSYTGIGFQLHYTHFKSLPEKWCWSCHGDWKVIVIDKTKSLKTISYNKNIKQVLSCVIVDLDSRSSIIQKSVNECDSLNEIVTEAIRQVYERHDFNHNPSKITVSENIFKSEDFGWESSNSSFSYSFKKLPFKGKTRNLYTVGPHNKEEVVVIDTAIESAQLFSTEVLKIKNVF